MLSGVILMLVEAKSKWPRRHGCVFDGVLYYMCKYIRLYEKRNGEVNEVIQSSNNGHVKVI